MIKVVGLGAGGHAKVVIEILRLMDQVELVGLLDAKEALWHTEVLGLPVLGGDHLLPQLYRQGVRQVFIGLGSTGNIHSRERLYVLARSNGFDVISAIHPHAVVSPSACIGAGATIMVGAIIGAQAQLGENVIINTGAIVEHDCVIGNHVHVATGAKLASTVKVGDRTHIGLGSCVRECSRIGQNVIVGAGAVVVGDVPNDVVVAGVPARVIRTRDGIEISD